MTRQDIEELHASLHKTPYQANRVLSQLSVLFGKAVEWEWRGDNPARRTKRFAEHGREEWYTPEELASLPPVPQRVVRTHPGSGRKTLYLAAHASHIFGMPIADGRLLLMDLIEHATQARFVHRHTWKQGDLVIWDNRCTMHRARPFDTSKVRDLRRVTTRDVASTLEQAA